MCEQEENEKLKRTLEQTLADFNRVKDKYNQAQDQVEELLKERERSVIFGYSYYRFTKQ